MKIKFDSALDYQHDAINAVVDLFAGQPLADAPFSVSLSEADANTLALTELGIGNRLVLDEETILTNLHSVQERNDIAKVLELQGNNFSVEMETGTGKTYVYLRSIFELNRRYGFSKFIIVVPSIPIREGVLASIEMMRDHFFAIYNTHFDTTLYDSKAVTRVRSFATANTLQVMVMNIQAFQRDVKDGEESKTANVINRESDRMSGRRPIEFLQATNPVVLVDEPQKMEGEKAAAAIERLNPLCTLRYSATHKNPYNLVYKLDPIQAYDRRLVKRVEVASVQADESVNDSFVRLVAVDNRKGLRAQIAINVADGANVKQKKVWVKSGDDLWHISKNRYEYKDGFLIGNISFNPGSEFIEFSNGRVVELNQEAGGLAEDLMREQVYETVKQHLQKEKLVKSRGIKVLSLFFIDKVASYRVYNEDGSRLLGKAGEWFETAFRELSSKPQYTGLITDPVDSLHNGYFARDRQNRYKDSTEKGSKDDEAAYHLIMSKKEELLSLDTPLRFIFSHSALREGWDNPNVFQICTLADAKSSDRKRQEIGRGLRLPVNQAGERIHDESINRLTVIANESYESFATSLQQDYVDDYGYRFGAVPPEAFARIAVAEVEGESVPAGQEKSKQLFAHLVETGYLTSDGQLTDACRPSDPNFNIDLPEEWELASMQVLDRLKRFDLRSRIKDARKRQSVSYNKKVELDERFQELWKRISQRTRYRVSFSSDALVGDAVKRMREAPAIRPLRINIEKVAIDLEEGGVRAERVLDTASRYTDRPATLPDVLGTLQNETQLTRRSLVKILVQSKRLDDFSVNPQAFVSMATECINKAMHSIMLAGITYEKIAGSSWEMRRLEEEAEKGITRYLDNLYKVQHQDKTLYDYVNFEGGTEREFAEELDNHERVELFVKLPSWFTIDTPIGTYNPDWALVTKGDHRLYFVRETKSTLDDDRRRKEENDKIACGRKHFDAINVDFDVTTDVRHMLDELPVGGIA